MKSSDLLLLVIPEDKSENGILTGKLFEYIGARVPVLGIGPTAGDAAKIINECKAGKMFNRSQEPDIILWLNNIICDEIYTKTSFFQDENLYLNYSRENLTKKLFEIIFKSKINF
jgi:hypothetical protein